MKNKATYNLNVFLICYIYSIVNCYADYNRDEVNNRKISNRHTGYQMCMDTFDIFEDKIIRTRDSIELGAKYVSEGDAATREDCYQHCCDTQSCDVFVFEEKRQGNCYLFECGPPDDFKCKFTKHRNYTSGVSKDLSGLESQIKFTQHEHELTNLREPQKNLEKNQNTPIIKTTAAPIGSKETLQLVPETKHVEKPSRCNHFQFECHTSHECIAVYNACDGIPNCADGSDEALELGCPSQQGNQVSATKETIKPSPSTQLPIVDKSKEQTIKVSFPPETKIPMDKTVEHHQYVSHESDKTGENESHLPANNINTNNFPNSSPQRQANIPNSRLPYGREGEGMSYRNGEQWYNDRNYHQNQENGQIFNHKGNPIGSQDRYPQSHSYQENNMIGNMGYNNEQPPNDINRYYYENPQYRMVPPNQYSQGAWPLQKPNEMNQFPGPEDPMMKSERFPNGGVMPQEYYYDENSYRSRQQMLDNRQQVGSRHMLNNQQHFVSTQEQPQQSVQHSHPPVQDSQTSYENKAHMELANFAKSRAEEQKNAKNIVQPKPTSTSPPSTAKPKVKEEHHQASHIKFEKLIADAAFAPSELDGHNASPSGAILSLTFGLLITAVMVVLVACRVRTVRRRLRRGGKAFAHDADFLVNGMYL